MSEQETGQKPQRSRRWPILLLFMAVAVTMYATIMYKIIHFGA